MESGSSEQPSPTQHTKSPSPKDKSSLQPVPLDETPRKKALISGWSSEYLLSFNLHKEGSEKPTRDRTPHFHRTFPKYVSPSALHAATAIHDSYLQRIPFNPEVRRDSIEKFVRYQFTELNPKPPTVEAVLV
ncbi:hypothetical protein V496_01799 [Pseudogymnoascus sp. VKM F-4515 (FW-2607)]|nr:hypothetical protein V496_01799 [Pseudogymnoascus sp. VKM F-4515 (FW-2607)]